MPYMRRILHPSCTFLENHFSIFTFLRPSSRTLAKKVTNESESKFESGLNPVDGELKLTSIGRLPYRLFLLKEEHASGNFPHGVYCTLNGQVDGDLFSNFITTTLKFDYLGRHFLVSVDCTEMDQAVRGFPDGIPR